jgi:hypothetical protein
VTTARAGRPDEAGDASSAECHELSAPDSAERWPDRTINDGRRTLGFVYDNEDGTATATDALGGMLGNFPNLERARSAIVEKAGRAGDD